MVRPGPARQHDNQISFLWTPGKTLVESIYSPAEGLQFAVREGPGKFTQTGKHEKYTPHAWLAEEFLPRGVLKLPSRPEPYGDVDSLATRVRAFIHRYFDCDEVFLSVSTLYVLMTWLYEAFQAVPYLRFLGESGHGKTRGTQTIGALCNRAFSVSGSITPAALYRIIEAMGGTMLIDEADYRKSDIGAEITRILNGGYAKDTPVIKNETVGDNWVPRVYEIFGPKIINGRKRFEDDAVENRCLSHVPVITQRRDIPAQLPPDFGAAALTIRNMALSWRLDTLDIFKVEDPGWGTARRAVQILTPLILVARQMSHPDDYEGALEAFAQSMDAAATDRKNTSVQGMLLKAYVSLTREGMLPTCKALAERVVEDFGGEDPALTKWLSAKTAGSILDQMGFAKRKFNVGFVVSMEPDRLRPLAESYGVNIGEHR